MTGAVIEVEGLRKQYRRLRGAPTVALDDLDLRVPAGGVFGFLGPNGAGKTTAVRCMLGLVRPTAGHVRLLGHDTPRHLSSVIDRVGSIVETPAQFPGLSGRRNLELLGGVDGIGRRRVDEVLELVGLGDRADHKVKGYSLGMRQRLGLGAALLRDPELVILDEPANGLDPAGIREFRQLLRRLGDEGRTVFVSSHLLSEVQQMCDHVAIIGRGRLIAAGAVDEVLHRDGATGVHARVPDRAAAAEVLSAAGMECVAAEDGTLLVGVEHARAAEVTEVLARAGIFVSELRPRELDLETVFLELTAEPGS
jgi:ABC-2 type transport system ATP-binding protein